ncbi:hypothetical protein B0H17DRAFT_1135047 [Mycena rosella]|uniref:Uncharacterized protein n=1 Tax=Mycena rosella TaxID=1033263 RepID=A0AAD7DG52_MYCRO|nr:hypothetical protein B0H17DRAFT_1135047 [Mycena rosella]
MAALHAGHPERVDYEWEEKLKALRDCKRILEEVDTRGFPVDAQTWCFMLWAFGRQVPVADRTPAMELAVNEFYMTDWHALLLGKLCMDYPSWRRSALQDNPTIKMQHAAQRDGGWKSCSLNGTPFDPAARFMPMRWGEDSLATINLNVVVTAFAHMGVSVSMIDDAFAFGEKWLQQWSERTSPLPEWTNTEINSLRQAADGISRPPGFNANHTDDLFPWPPVLPWMLSADTVAAFQLANYRHPELAGMRLQPNSVVQARIASGMWGNPPENKGVIPHLNPFLPGNKERFKAARIRAAPVPTAGLTPSFTPVSN